MTITVEQVIATLEEVVAEKGEDYVYPQKEKKHDFVCVYAEPDGSPSCIVGYVVARLDPETFNRFRIYEDEYGSFGIDQTFRITLDDEIPRLADWEDDSKIILTAAQRLQDNGKTWGEALTAAKAAL